MNITRLKKMPTKNGIYFDATNQELVEIVRNSEEWCIIDYPHCHATEPFTKDSIKELRLYGPIVLKG